MKSLEIQFPESLHLSNEEIKIFIAVKLYEAGELTIGQASEMSGLERNDFMAKLSLYNVDFFKYSASELETDLRNAKESIR